MRPTFFCFDSRDSVRLDAVLSSNNCLKALIFSNSNNVSLAQLGGCTSGSPIRCAMMNAVALIGGRGIPSQIFKSIVGRIAVVMAALHALWLWAVESKHNGAMYAHHFGFVVLPKKNAAPPSAGLLVGGFKNSGSDAPNVSKVRDFIAPLKTGNVAPDFRFIHRKCPLPGFGHFNSFTA